MTPDLADGDHFAGMPDGHYPTALHEPVCLFDHTVCFIDHEPWPCSTMRRTFVAPELHAIHHLNGIPTRSRDNEDRAQEARRGAGEWRSRAFWRARLILASNPSLLDGLRRFTPR